MSSVFSAEALIGDTVQKSNQINTSNHRLVFKESEKLEDLEKNLSEQSKEPVFYPMTG